PGPRGVRRHLRRQHGVARRARPGVAADRVRNGRRRGEGTMTRKEGTRAAATGRRVAWIVAGVMAWPGGALHGQVETAALAAEVEAREVAFARTLADRDLEAFPTYISPDAVFFNGEVPIRGREAIVAAWTGFFETP